MIKENYNNTNIPINNENQNNNLEKPNIEDTPKTEQNLMQIEFTDQNNYNQNLREFPIIINDGVKNYHLFEVADRFMNQLYDELNINEPKDKKYQNPINFEFIYYFLEMMNIKNELAKLNSKLEVIKNIFNNKFLVKHADYYEAKEEFFILNQEIFLEFTNKNFNIEEPYIKTFRENILSSHEKYTSENGDLSHLYLKKTELKEKIQESLNNSECQIRKLYVEKYDEDFQYFRSKNLSLYDNISLELNMNVLQDEDKLKKDIAFFKHLYEKNKSNNYLSNNSLEILSSPFLHNLNIVVAEIEVKYSFNDDSIEESFTIPIVDMMRTYVISQDIYIKQSKGPNQLDPVVSSNTSISSQLSLTNMYYPKEKHSERVLMQKLIDDHLNIARLFYDRIEEIILAKNPKQFNFTTFNLNLYSPRIPCSDCKKCLEVDWKFVFDNIIQKLEEPFIHSNVNLCLENLESIIHANYSIPDDGKVQYADNTKNKITRVDEEYIVWCYNHSVNAKYTYFISSASLPHHKNHILILDDPKQCNNTLKYDLYNKYKKALGEKTDSYVLPSGSRVKELIDEFIVKKFEIYEKFTENMIRIGKKNNILTIKTKNL